MIGPSSSSSLGYRQVSGAKHFERREPAPAVVGILVQREERDLGVVEEPRNPRGIIGVRVLNIRDGWKIVIQKYDYGQRRAI